MQTHPESRVAGLGPAGTVRALFVKPDHRVPMRSLDQVQAVEGKGLQGDAAFGRPTRQVLLIEEETLDEFGLEPGRVRENVVVRGVRLAGLPEGTIIRLGDASLAVTMDCAPCELIENIRPGLRAAMEGRRGTLCRVELGGAIRAGDPVIVEGVA